MGEMIEFPSNGSTAGGLPRHPRERERARRRRDPGVVGPRRPHQGGVRPLRRGRLRGARPRPVPRQKVPPGARRGRQGDDGDEDGPGRPRHERRSRRVAAPELGGPGRRHRLLHGRRAGARAGDAAPGRGRAVVPCYGIIPWPDAQPDYSAMSAAVLGHYAGKDSFFTPEAANELGERLRALGKEVEIVIYPGPTTRSSTTPARGLRRGCGTTAVGPHVGLLLVAPGLSAPRRAAAGEPADRLLPSGHVRTLPRPAPPLVPLHAGLEREVPGQGADGGRRHDVPRPRGRRRPPREGRRPGQGGRRDQEPRLGRPGAVRAGQRLGHRVDLRRRDRGGGQRRRAPRRGHAAQGAVRRRGGGARPAAHPGGEELAACRSATSGSRRRSRRPVASSTSRRSAPPRRASRRSSSGRPTSPPPWRCRCSPAGSTIPEYPGDHFHYVFPKILMAGRANGLQVIDGPFLKVRDLDALREFSQRTRMLGYDGKWALTPDQAAVLERGVLADPGAVRPRLRTSSTPTRRRPRRTARGRSCSATR